MPDHIAGPLLALVASREQAYLDLLARMVAIDSGSTDPDGVNQLGTMVAAELVARSWDVTTEQLAHDGEGGRVGDLVVARIAGRVPATDGGQRVLLLAHLDTVFEPGEAGRRPFSIDDAGHAHGPGVCDDKSGIAAAIVAVDTCVAAGLDTWSEVVLALTPDEEIGSPASRGRIAELGAEADAALCLEAARANGDLVSARKGAADVVIELTGRAAHAGIEPEKGAHALLAAARLVEQLQALGGGSDGVTVNVGQMHGGHRANIVPDHAELVVDFRAWDTLAFDATHDRIAALVATEQVSDVTATMRVISSAPPMEKTAGAAAMVMLARNLAEAIGFDVNDAATGGAADANTVAAQGTPTLDGVGPVGGNDHAPSEYLDVASVVPRVAMLAGLISTLGHGPLDLAG